jgi:endonuclease/exonuclease/phosphatase family metal-dependent hydrolase
MIIITSCIVVSLLIVNYVYKKSKKIVYNNNDGIFNDKKYMKVLTYNVQRIPYMFRKNIDIKSLLETYDVICLQENFTSFLGTNKNHFGCNCVMPGCNVFKLTDSGLSIYSRYDITYIDFIPFKNLRSVDKYSSKGFLLVQIKDIIFVNTHLQSIYKESDNEIAMKQLQQILDKCSIFFKVVILGDFNLNLNYFFNDEKTNYNVIKSPIPTHWNKPYEKYNTYASAVPGNNLFPYFYDGGFYKNVEVKNINTERHDMLTDHLGVSFDLIDMEVGITDEYFYTYLGSI